MCDNLSPCQAAGSEIGVGPRAAIAANLLRGRARASVETTRGGIRAGMDECGNECNFVLVRLVEISKRTIALGQADCQDG